MLTGWWVRTRAPRAFARASGGNVAMMWALIAVVLVGLVGVSVDFTRAQMLRQQLQNAVDGAALAAARGTMATLDQRTAAARAFFDSEAGQYANSASFSVTPLDDGTYRVQASVPMPMSLAAVVSNHDWDIGVTSEAQQSGINVEVALVLDTTGSMSGQKIIDMQNAATSLVNTVVRAQQTPFYSKVALVPFSRGVETGGYANSVRGPVTGGTTITGADWRSGSSRNITSISRSGTAITITSNGHGFANGDVVGFQNTGLSQLNGHYYTVSNVATNTFRVTGSNSGSSSGSGGTATKCLTSACEVVVTSNSHGLSNGDYVYITGVNGMTQINSAANTTWQVSNSNGQFSANKFVLSGTNGPGYSDYTSGGTSYCVRQGCQYYRFTNRSGSTRVFGITTCVSDRTGANAYTDVAPSTTYVGRNYSIGGDQCQGTGQIMPLTTDTNALNARIASLQAGGGTAGHLGTAWGWYMLSPNFGYLWPSASQPAAYGAPNTVKIMVLMTDGEYNLSYCNGVESAGGSNSSEINCNSPNGDSPTQAAALCTAMKAQGVIVYTVGFQLGGSQSAINLLTNCASDQSHFYNADSGADLQAAFQSIANQITQLRISH